MLVGSVMEAGDQRAGSSNGGPLFGWECCLGEGSEVIQSGRRSELEFAWALSSRWLVRGVWCSFSTIPWVFS